VTRSPESSEVICRRCGSPMVQRRASRGTRQGGFFWGRPQCIASEVDAATLLRAPGSAPGAPLSSEDGKRIQPADDLSTLNRPPSSDR
jgi:hypothetical protein